MKLALKVKLAALTTIALTSIIPSSRPVNATDYGEQEVEQNQFIAVVAPFGSNNYNLVVIEQISGQKQCWNERGSQPIIIEPLWTTFDFTGSCRRATDSNGYSIRIDGQDYGINYLLSIVERDGELLLVGTPRGGDRNLSEIIVGRSYGINNGFTKILLNPGWRFTKRTFEGKTLGHVYFSGDRLAMNHSGNVTAATSSPAETTESQTLSPLPQSHSATTKAETDISPIAPEEENQTLPLDRTPLPQSNSTSPENEMASTTTDNDSQLLPSTSTDSSVDKLSVPNLPIPVSDLSNSPSNPVASTVPAKSYRVIVETSNSSQESQVLGLYPQAFRTVYNGKSMLQVGLFSERQNAENTLQNIQNLGWDGMIVEN